jgi:hypothetical protein
MIVEKLNIFKTEFPALIIENQEIQLYLFEDEIEERKTYQLISGFDGNSSLQVRIENEEELENLSIFLRNKPFIFNDFLAIKYDTTIEILLTNISFRNSIRTTDLDDANKDNFKIIDVGLNYHKNELDISLQVGFNNNFLPSFASLIRGRMRYLRRKPIILKIKNYQKPTVEGIENDTRNILNSVLFDIEYNYDIALETINIESLNRRVFRSKRKTNQLPKEKINLVYKKYIPELIQYFHIAEKVDFLPFKFICYYHIIEYFSDKSAYHLVSSEVKKLLLKPDFHLKTDDYVTTAINLFKRENDKYTGDKNKVERVFKQYIIRDELKEILTELDIIENFSKEVILDCNKPLKLPAINFNQDGNFYSELTKRIYMVRCSIVHSNPDFDESKAVPFNPTPNNIEKLRIETELIMEIARKIIVDTKE